MSDTFCQITVLPTSLFDYTADNGLDAKRILGEINATLKEEAHRTKVGGYNGKLGGKLLKSGKDTRKFTLRFKGDSWEVAGHRVQCQALALGITVDSANEEHNANLLYAPRVEVSEWLNKFQTKPATLAPVERKEETVNA